jgi:hypothetical protein
MRQRDRLNVEHLSEAHLAIAQHPGLQTDRDGVVQSGTFNGPPDRIARFLPPQREARL